MAKKRASKKGTGHPASPLASPGQAVVDDVPDLDDLGALDPDDLDGDGVSDSTPNVPVGEVAARAGGRVAGSLSGAVDGICAVSSVGISAPLAVEDSSGYKARHFEFRLHPDQARVLARLTMGLAVSGARLKIRRGQVIGRPISTSVDALRYLLERFEDSSAA